MSSLDAVYTLVSSMAGVQIGIIISAWLFGIVTLQAFFYYTTYPDDRRFLKIFAALIWLLELAGMIFASNLLYSAAITPYRENPALMFINAPYQVEAIIIITNWSGCVAQIYFVDRIRRFTESYIVPVICWILILYTIGAVIAVTVVLEKYGVIGYSLRYQWLSISGLFVAAAIDVIIAVVLTYSLMQERQSLFQRSTRLVDRIILMTVSTGVLTSILANVAGILLVCLPNSMLYLGLYICLARVYANSFYASLNARNMLRGTEDVIGSFRFASRSAAQNGTTKTVEFAGRAGFRASARKGTDAAFLMKIGSGVVFGPALLYLLSPSSRKSAPHVAHGHDAHPATPVVIKDDEGTPADVTAEVNAAVAEDAPKADGAEVKATEPAEPVEEHPAASEESATEEVVASSEEPSTPPAPEKVEEQSSSDDAKATNYVSAQIKSAFEFPVTSLSTPPSSMALHDVVQQLRDQQHESELQHKHNHAERPSIDIPQVQDNPPEQTTPRLNQHDPSSKRLSAQFRSPPTTPSMRTGPPRSLSYSYSIPNSPVNSRNNSRMIEASEPIDILPEGVEQGGEYFAFSRRNTDFRGALEYSNSFDPSDRKGKRRESRVEESWNPMKWFYESPREEKPQFDFGVEGSRREHQGETTEEPGAVSEGEGFAGPSTPKIASSLRRVSSVPHSPHSPHSPHEKTKPGLAKWGRLRSLLPTVASQSQPPTATPGPSAVTHPSVNITDELITGGLSTLMLRLWFERDERDLRRVPVLLHRLRIRVSDSLHPLHGHKSVFRIECEYANGAARWVIYRQLQDFISLHYHYTLSNAYNRSVDKLPEFPRTSLPYFKFLKRESHNGQVAQAEFARLQREALENYLIELIRAVMFHPSSNRLSGFFEISALFISLAQSGGAQHKAGYLRIEDAGNKAGGGFGRKSVGWREKREQRWCAVRESYLVILQEPGELVIWDVFLIDQDFKLHRPKRLYRQPLSLLHPDSEASGLKLPPDNPRHAQSEIDNKSIVASVRSKISKALSLGGRRKRPQMNGMNLHNNVEEEEDDFSDRTSDMSVNIPAPMLDPSTNVNPLAEGSDIQTEGPPRPKTPAGQRKAAANQDVSKHTFYIENSQVKLKLIAKNERQMLQWIASLEKLSATSHYTGGNRFDSFAPIRMNVAAQWLVDGRDYFWNLSRAILLAKESIYIHDWWLSPELQMRRPNKDRYRLDRLLERKAKEGVKIHIILYQEVSNRTTPTDSNYAKQRLASLHPNVMIQRSPSHFQTGTFYWAHHEKLCVIDQTIAFTGGVDLCFGRWDTPQHVLTDDIDPDTGASEIWPGKDYSNPRVMDFHTLNKPEEDMYDRTKVPRMPWQVVHDVGMQVVGQPARDLARHFVQRWNYLLRIKNHSRLMPFLLPPPEFKPGELSRMGLTGTCEMQICRSAGPWSLGTNNRIEHSIEHAYLKAIHQSEHFIYIENQFFITSTVVNDVRVENRIGEAISQRIIRAHREGTPFKCCILIPLLPGFTFPVDHSDASAIRIILECQNRTIARGPHSIFGRLRKEGINPDDYISVFSLRNWAKLRGGVLTTEQVYIHGKVCIVDDRWAIIGSANINERSQRGDRDSELAAVIRDTDLIDCTMAGKPFKVGRFAHSLRVRLMREHLGIDVDALDEEDLMANEPPRPEHEQEEWDPNREQERGVEGVTHVDGFRHQAATGRLAHVTAEGLSQMANAAVETTTEGLAHIARKTGLASGRVMDAVNDSAISDERKTFDADGNEESGFPSSVIPTLEERIVAEKSPAYTNRKGYRDDPPESRTKDGELYGAPAAVSKVHTDDSSTQPRMSEATTLNEFDQAPPARAVLRKHLDAKLDNKTWTIPTPRPEVTVDCFEDPVSDSFWKDIWVASAVRNTEIFRKVFHAIPDDLITTWKQYKEFVTHHERLNKAPGDTIPPSEPVARVPSEAGDEAAPMDSQTEKGLELPQVERQSHSKEGGEDELEGRASTSYGDREPKPRKPARGPEPFEQWERDEMEKLLGELNGHLVIHPTRFLEGEDIANNFLFNADRLLPLPIYD
ncbi:hypothetical protein ONZ45_g3982 [Pleurotus djamor]|nr:hypothetical protein ONZ45_g3982 [Pleurotus djamor]